MSTCRLGLALDYTSSQVVVPHPFDPTAPDLPACPVLFVATSDGVFRTYAFGNLNSMSSLVHEPETIPAAAVPVVQVEAVPVDQEAAAAAAPLPSEDELSEVRVIGCGAVGCWAGFRCSRSAAIIAELSKRQ